MASVLRRRDVSLIEGSPEVKAVILDAYRVARGGGMEPAAAAVEAWWATRVALPSLRAPYWGEAVDGNRPSGRRSYRLPLAEAYYGREESRRQGYSDIGGHAGAWRRTLKSATAVKDAQAAFLVTLEEAP